MKNLKGFLKKAYLLLFALIGPLLLILSLYQLKSPSLWMITIVVALLGVAADLVPTLHLRELAISVGNVMVIFSIIASSDQSAVVVISLSMLTFGLIGAISPFMVAVNIGQAVLSVEITGYIWFLFEHQVPPTVAAIICVAGYFFSNTLIAGTLISIRQHVSLPETLKAIYGNIPFSLAYLATTVIGAVAGLLYRDWGISSVVISIPMYLFLRQMLQQRIDDANIIQEYAQEVKRRYNASITSLAHAIDARDSYTFGHSLRVAALSKRLAAKMDRGLNVEEIFFGGLLHDIGKIAIPDSILLKPGMLEASELVTMMSHPVLGEQILRDSGVSGNILAIVRWHHEWVAGGGYPDDKSGDDIPFVARLVSVPDAFDAMVSNRPYRRGCTVENALERLVASAGRQFDRHIVNAMIQVVEQMTEEEMVAIGYDNEPIQEVPRPIVDLPGSDLTLAERLDASRRIIEWETTAMERYALEAPKGGNVLFWRSRYGHLPSMFPGGTDGKAPSVNVDTDFSFPSVAAGLDRD